MISTLTSTETLNSMITPPMLRHTSLFKGMNNLINSINQSARGLSSKTLCFLWTTPSIKTERTSSRTIYALLSSRLIKPKEVSLARIKIQRRDSSISPMDALAEYATQAAIHNKNIKLVRMGAPLPAGQYWTRVPRRAIQLVDRCS
jgi:hypothetical protein